MRLSEHFKKTITETYIDEQLERYNELLPKIKEFENIFIKGIKFPTLRVEKDGSISYDGEIEFSKSSYVDNTGKMPFKFNKVDGVFTMLNGYADKLSTLEGLPTECADLNIKLTTHKPPSFFEGHFPKKLANLDLEAVSLQNCKFGIEEVTKKIELSVEENGLKNFEGLPTTIPRLTLNFPPSWVRSFKGLNTIHVIQFWTSGSGTVQFELGDLVEHVKSVYKIATDQSDIRENTPMLSVFKIPDLRELDCTSILVSDCKNVFRIISKYLADGDVFSTQDELIDENLAEYAKTK